MKTDKIYKIKFSFGGSNHNNNIATVWRISATGDVRCAFYDVRSKKRFFDWCQEHMTQDKPHVFLSSGRVICSIAFTTDGSL